MTPGKTAWKNANSFCHLNRLEFGNIKESAKNKRIFFEYRLEREVMASDLSDQEQVDILHDMDGGEEDDLIEVRGPNDDVIVDCLERFFKNPQTSYEVPVQLLQEWFSETSLNRRYELARVLLSVLVKQGVDLKHVLGPLCDESTHVGKSEVFFDVEDASQESSSITGNGDVTMETASVCLNNQTFSDPVVLKTLREFRPTANKPKQESLLSPLSRSLAFSESVPEDCEEIITLSDDEHLHDKHVETAEVAVYASEHLDANNVSSDTIDGSDPNSVSDGLLTEFPISSNEKKTRSIGTSPIKDSSKYSTEPSVFAINPHTRTLIDKSVEHNLRKSSSLSVMQGTEQNSSPPPLLLITSAPKEKSPSKQNGIPSDRSHPVQVKVTVISCIPPPVVTTTKASTAFKSQASKQVKLSGIERIPELVSCTTPSGGKSAPLLVHSSIDAKQPQNAMEMSNAAENVVVSQSTSSHTIHYTPSTSHIVSSASAAGTDKCSVVYIDREDRAHAQPVLVTTPTPTWQEQARKKPIIAYAKRKSNEERVKVLIAQNANVNEENVTATKVVENDNVGVIANIRSVQPSAGDRVFIRKTTDSKVNIAETPKPTLPKFNQTFVHNFQLKPVRIASPAGDVVPNASLSTETNRKLPKKLSATYSPVPHVAAETTVVTEETVASESSSPSLIQSTNTNVVQPPVAPVVVESSLHNKSTQNSSPQQQPVGLLIYTHGTSDETTPAPTLLLTTLPNGSTYCVQLPPNLPTSVPAVPAVETSRPLQNALTAPVTVKSPLKKPESLAVASVAPPVESNKVELLNDLREFENVFEETKLKFEKEKQLNVTEMEPSKQKVALSPQHVQPLQTSPTINTTQKIEGEKVVVGVKRRPDGELPVLTRFYTTAKKPLFVVTNYGQAAGTASPRPIFTQTCTATTAGATQLVNRVAKAKPRSGKTYPNPSKSPPSTKPQQKPQEDEKTQQKIYAILEEYAVQKEHSPDTNNRPAPRRRSNPPSSSASKKKRPIIKSKDSGGDTDEGSYPEM